MDSELIVVDRSDEFGGRGGALEDLTDAINIICHRHYGPKRGGALVELLAGSSWDDVSLRASCYPSATMNQELFGLGTQ